MGGGTLAHCIYVCIRNCHWHQPGCINLECLDWESIDWKSINRIVSIRLYMCSRLRDLDFGQRSLLSKELDIGQIVM